MKLKNKPVDQAVQDIYWSMLKQGKKLVAVVVSPAKYRKLIELAGSSILYTEIEFENKIKKEGVYIPGLPLDNNSLVMEDDLLKGNECAVFVAPSKKYPGKSALAILRANRSDCEELV